VGASDPCEGPPMSEANGAEPSQGCTPSLSVRLVSGNVSFLLPGRYASAPAAGWPPSTVFRLARSGSSWVNPPEMLASVNPSVAIISVDADNRYGLPAAVVLDGLAGRTLLRTDQHGSIHISTDGVQLWVQPERWP
jgi:competence protein ComEC